METSDNTLVDGTTQFSGLDTSEVLNTRQISELGNELDAHMKGIMRVSTSLLNAALFEGNKEAVVKAEKDVKEAVKKLGDVAYDLCCLADDARAHFGIAEESDGASIRKQPKRKRTSSAVSARVNKKSTMSKKKAGKRSATRSSSSSSSSSAVAAAAESNSTPESELPESSSSSEKSDETIEQSGDEDEGTQLDTPATPTTPHNHQGSRAGEMHTLPVS